MIRDSLPLVAATLLLSSSLWAAPCAPGTLQSYLALGPAGCSVGSVDYTSFAIVPGQNFATLINPGNVTVTPGGTQYQTLLSLTLNQTANAGDLLDLIFRVQASGLLTAATTALNSPTVTGNGAATGILDVCIGGTFAGNAPSGCSTVPTTSLVAAIAGDASQSDRVNFSATPTLDLFFNLTLDGGSNGSAGVGSASFGVNAVPEPAVTWLVLGGLGVIGYLRRRG